MRLRLSIGLLLAGLVLLASPAASGQESASEQKQIVDGRINTLEEKIEAAREREGVLSAEIEVVTDKIDALQSDVDAASARLDQLETVLALHQQRLDRLNKLYELQTRKLVFLQHQHREAVARLSKRLVEIYTSERTSSLSVVLSSGNFSDMLDQLEFLRTIGRQDHKIAGEVESAKLQMQATRNSTRRTRRQVAETTRAVAARTAEQRAVRDRLAWSQRELATARRDKRASLSEVQEDKEAAIGHMRDLQAESAALAAKIRSAQSAVVVPAPTGAASAAGFVWPVHGVLTSGFGWRWGRMHEGVDIAVSNGTPVVAAAAGTVIVAGWMGGYGNLVVVDHGGGISTAYGHNTSVTVGLGQQVAQGQLIAYSGNTGHSTGPHVHFEVRINGGAVDPMGYL
ncbi:MAG TPA: peptidoglycan DD-metalloendopeptidase family protein [Gaiellaceae bacterium]|nr:peptidoglycan DD-metalloendopeptidase family protein [Gaiellaceae bacterium]